MSYRLRKRMRRSGRPKSQAEPTSIWDRRFKILARVELLAGIVAIPLVLVVGFNELTALAEQRRVNAWQLLTAKAEGNAGKVAALEYLNSGHFCFPLSSWCRYPKERLIRLSLQEKTYLAFAELPGVELEQAILEDVDLGGSDLRGAILSKANLRAANLNHADLRAANLRHADLTRAHLKNTKLSGVIVENTNVTGAIFEGNRARVNEFLEDACTSPGGEPPKLNGRSVNLKFPICLNPPPEIMP